MATLPTIRRSRQAGFTIIELMVVVSVLAVLGALAAPAMNKLVAAQRLRTASFDLVSDITLARSEALKRAGSVTMARQGTDWANGWTVATTVGALTLGQRNSLGTGLTLTVKQGTSTINSFTFEPNGRVTGSSQITFEISNSQGSRRCVKLDVSGRPKTQTTACA